MVGGEDTGGGQGGERHAKFYIEDSSLIINMVSYKLS